MAHLASPEAEWSVAASMLQQPKIIAQVIGTQLDATDFIREDAALLFGSTVESYYADQPTEPLTTAERLRPKLARLWRIPPEEVTAELLRRLDERDRSTHTLEHAALVKRLSTRRRLGESIDEARSAVLRADLTAEEIAATLSTEVLAITAGQVRRTELYDWMDVGREYVKYLRRQRLAREKGIELAVYTGMPFIDDFTKGIAPTELAMLGGAPGTGKSILGWAMGQSFAGRQLKKPPAERVGTLVLSMEMGLVPSSTRLAQSITGIDGVRLREGQIEEREYQRVVREWKVRDGLPIFFNFASNFRLSQMRALVVEAIRKHNVGFVVIDHFRMLDCDEAVRDVNDADEKKIRFLKEQLAKDLNIAVLCLAHTTKMGRASEGNPRPRMADLRGSGQIAANADLIGLLHRPYDNASEKERFDLAMNETDAEIIWVKCRHSAKGCAYLKLDASNMTAEVR